jgi:hypothetical protein
VLLIVVHVLITRWPTGFSAIVERTLAALRPYRHAIPSGDTERHVLTLVTAPAADPHMNKEDLMSMRERGASGPTIVAVACLMLGLIGCTLEPGLEEAVGAAPLAITSNGTISGTVFEDMNRNAAPDPGEAGMAGMRLYLFDGQGTYLANTLSDAGGRYAFGGLADGTYRLAFDSPSWWSVRDAWVPTTTGGDLFPQRTVSLSAAAVADFGLRPIVRSTNIAAPIASFTGPNGLVVESYDDVVSPADVYASIMAGLVGPEAAHVVVRFDYGSATTTSTSVSLVGGQYSGYGASVSIGYDMWLDTRDVPIAHEYGHAWSLYNAYVVQQDPTMSSYLAARGLAGDSRVNSTYSWSTREMIAEDYRQLFGAPDARYAPQINSDIPPASAVPGLHDFLLYTFAQPPAAPPPPPPPALAVSGPTITPSTGKSVTVSFGLSAAASVTLTIRTAGGTVVRTLLANASEPTGSTSVTWDRRDSGGHLVASGAYTARVDAVGASSQTATASVAFSVN